MADSPFSNPTIHARIAADVLRIQSTWLEWNAEPTTEDFDTKIVETLVDTLVSCPGHNVIASDPSHCCETVSKVAAGNRRTASGVG